MKKTVCIEILILFIGCVQSLFAWLSGVLLYSDGQPVTDGFVSFEAAKVEEGYDGKTHTSTDSQGRFRLSVLEGFQGSLWGFIYSFEGKYLNCPKLDKLVREKDSGVPDIETKRLQVEVNSDVDNIELKFPFPRCVKAKIE